MAERAEVPAPSGAGAFAAWVRSARTHAGLTQEELAERAGLSPRTVRNVESGRSGGPSAHTRRSLVTALGAAGEHEPVPAARPAQIPPDMTTFVGRAGELSELDTVMSRHHASATPVVVICGPAGVGKTALAVRWAHRMRVRHPDGQLFVNLRGHSPGEPMAAGEALVRLLHACGLTDQQIPADQEERSSVLRSLLADRRMLLLLDNASSAAQVRPLLPATATCTVVITSRDPLGGLVARDGAARLELDPLPAADALDLLRSLIGKRAVAEPEAADQLATYCVHLPLALRVAAELAVSRPRVRLQDLVTELSAGRTLSVLDAAVDDETAVTTVFSWSYHHLDPPAARAFRLIAGHPGPDLDLAAAAALLDADIPEATRLLEVLIRAYLIQVAGENRYAMHDLLRIYAAELALDGRDQETAGALNRLFDHYLAWVSRATDLVNPTGSRSASPEAGAGTSPPDLLDEHDALLWLESHRTALIAAAAVASAAGRPDYAIELSSALRRYLDSGIRTVEALTVHELALAAARQTNDRNAEVLALMYIGNVHWRLADYPAATRYLQTSYDLAGDLGDTRGQALALNNLGGVAAEQGHWDQAAERCGRAVQLHRQTGDVHSEAITEANLGLINVNLDRIEPAIDHTRRALRLSRRLGERYGEANALTYLGLLLARQGQIDTALTHQRAAMHLYRQIGHRPGEAGSLKNIGDLHRRLGAADAAIGFHQQALDMFREGGDPGGEVRALNGLADALHAAGQLQPARATYQQALRIADETGSGQELGRAHDGIGRVLLDLGEPAAADHHWRSALELYEELHLPEAEDVRARLASCGHRSREDRG